MSDRRSSVIAGTVALVGALSGGALAGPAPDPIDHLVPEIATWRAQVARVDGLLADADALRDATAALHNGLAEAGTLTGVGLDCSGPSRVAWTARAARTGDAWRRYAQQLRMEAALLTELAASPAVFPLLAPEDTQAQAARTARVGAHAHEVLEAAAWHARYAAPRHGRCPPPDDAPAPASGPRSGDAVAVIASGGGRVCPVDLPADDRAVVLPGGLGCWLATREGPCDCAPTRFAPGARMGPVAPSVPTR